MDIQLQKMEEFLIGIDKLIWNNMDPSIDNWKSNEFTGYVENYLLTTEKETILNWDYHPAYALISTLAKYNKWSSPYVNGIAKIIENFGWEKSGIHIFKNMRNELDFHLFKYNMNQNIDSQNRFNQLLHTIFTLSNRFQLDWDKKNGEKNISILEIISIPEYIVQIFKISETKKQHTLECKEYWKSVWLSVLATGEYFPYVLDKNTKFTRLEIVKFLPEDIVQKINILKDGKMTPEEIIDIIESIDESGSIETFDSVPIDFENEIC